MAGGAPKLEAVVLAVAERAGELVVVEKSLGDGGGDDVEGVGGSVGGGDVSAEVAEGEVEVAVGVEVGEREGVVVEEGRGRRKDENTLCGFDDGFHDGYGYGYVFLLGVVPLPPF